MLGRGQEQVNAEVGLDTCIGKSVPPRNLRVTGLGNELVNKRRIGARLRAGACTLWRCDRGRSRLLLLLLLLFLLGFRHICGLLSLVGPNLFYNPGSNSAPFIKTHSNPVKQKDRRRSEQSETVFIGSSSEASLLLVGDSASRSESVDDPNRALQWRRFPSRKKHVQRYPRGGSIVG